VHLASSGLISLVYPELEVGREMRKIADQILAS